MGLFHSFVSSKPQGADATKASKNEWNAEHVVDTGGLTYQEASADPATPAAGQSDTYVKVLAGRAAPWFINDAGERAMLQACLCSARIVAWLPGTGTLPTYLGQSPTLAATASHPAPATTGAVGTLMSRAQFATSTTAGNAAGLRAAANMHLIGDGTNKGGFYFTARFNQGSLHTTGVQKMVGLRSGTTQLGGDPSSTQPDFCGLCLDAADATWQFARRTGSGTAVKVSTGVAAAANVVFDLYMYIAHAGTALFVRVDTVNNDGTVTNRLDTSYNTTLPAVTTLLGPVFEVRNGALAAAHNMALNRLYVESAL